MVHPIPSTGSIPSPTHESTGSSYTAKFGDTVESILERFGLGDTATRQAFFELNPGIVTSGLVTPGRVLRIPAPRLSAGASDGSTTTLATAWTSGFGRTIAGQNDYNESLRAAQLRWPDVDPLVLKSILAQETGFREQTFASNPFGYAGVAQLGIAEAHEAGLRTGASRMRSRAGRPVYDRTNDERFDPAKAIPAAAVILRNKDRALRHGVETRSGTRLRGYERYGEPGTDDRWRFAAAAYNSGQGTILRAMRYAYGDTPPSEVKWADLLRSPTGNVRDSPLWRAIVDVGMNPETKFREITEYATNVVARARQ